MNIQNHIQHSTPPQPSPFAQQRTMALAMEKISAGYEAQAAQPTTAGLTLSYQMTAQIRALDQALHSTNDHIGLLQTAEGAMVEQSRLLQRMRELTEQAATAAFPREQAQILQQQMVELRNSVDRIADTTRWNGELIIAGSSTLATTITTRQMVQLDFTEIDTQQVSNGDALSITIGGIKYESVFDGQGFPPFMLAGGGMAPKGMFDIQIDNVNKRVTVRARMEESFTVAHAASTIQGREPALQPLDLSGGQGQSRAAMQASELSLTAFARSETVSFVEVLSQQWQRLAISPSTDGVPGALNTGSSSGLATADITEPEAAQELLPKIDEALRTIQQHRDFINAFIERIVNTGSDLSSRTQQNVNWSPPLSDAGTLAKIKEISREQIMKQADVAMLAQANPKPLAVMHWLQ